MNSVRSHNLCLKCQRFTASGRKDIGIRLFDYLIIRLFDFVGKTNLVYLKPTLLNQKRPYTFSWVIFLELPQKIGTGLVQPV